MAGSAIFPARSNRAPGPVDEHVSERRPTVTAGHALPEAGNTLSGHWHQAVIPSKKHMNRLLTATTGVVLSLAGIGGIKAAPALPLAQPKAANLARMRAESLNGGLGSYRAAACMYETGAGTCLVSKSAQGFLFSFPGGPPGWEQESPARPTLETRVLVSRDGQRILAVPYNGPIP